MRTRKLITISLPPPLLKKAERVAAQENRTKSELVREALRFYVDTRDIRRIAAREQVFALIERIQRRARALPARNLRRAIREAIEAARARAPRSRA